MYDPKMVDVSSEEFLKADYIILANIDHAEFETTLEAYLYHYSQVAASEELGDDEFGFVYLVILEKDVKLLDRQGEPLDIIKAAVVLEKPTDDVLVEVFDDVQEAKDAYEKYEAKYLKHLQEE